MSGARTGAEVEMWDDADRVWVEPSLALADGDDVLTEQQVRSERTCTTVVAPLDRGR